ncbi:MAG: SDR family oxidoreductase [Motiliproteus sp.]
MATVLLVGCGDIGTRLGLQLSLAGHHCIGLKRHLNQLPAPIQGLQADVTDPASLDDLPEHDYLVYSLVPSEYSAAGYQRAYVDGLTNLLAAIAQQQLCPKRLFFISSSAIYHQRDGAWVDELSDTLPTSFSGQAMQQAEAILNDSVLAGTAVRLSGIYGPGRERLFNWVRQGVGASDESTHYGNRIHIDDCVGVLQFLLEKDLRGEPLADCYLASDPHPASYHEVLEWLRQQMDLPKPEQYQDFNLKIRSGSKRCRPQRLLDAGYQFHHQDYRSGYRSMLKAMLADPVAVQPDE